MISNANAKALDADRRVRAQQRIRSANEALGSVRSLPDQLDGMRHALTAKDLAGLLQVSEVTIYKFAKSNRIPSFRIGTAVRFDPVVISQWLRQM
jgi:excisionase family DNA binding protein